jgi:pyruvate dehydrogenase E2 component (dihydrolipoamide acetyltransferase)
VKAAAVALSEHPDVNARLVGAEIQRLAAVNIGVAVETKRGLLVPVVRRAERKSVLAIARESAALVQRTRAARNLPDDFAGGTFTITNLGMFEIDAFTPIINLPECAILGAGRIRKKPVVAGGEGAEGDRDGTGDRVVVRPMLWLSLTFDHRLLDGAPAARFLQHIKRLIEDPPAEWS